MNQELYTHVCSMRVKTINAVIDGIDVTPRLRVDQKGHGIDTGLDFFSGAEFVGVACIQVGKCISSMVNWRVLENKWRCRSLLNPSHIPRRSYASDRKVWLK
jgi:hypothetical protein